MPWNPKRKDAIPGTTPRTFSHIGLSVPDLDAAAKFYSEVLGFYVVMPPSEAEEDESAIGVM